ncbi:MAG: hypothetical protein WC819_04800 [Parcubacteria group bacterium]|jgi:hypothetical protein
MSSDNMKTIAHFIDCDADPSIPKGWKVERHNKCGQLEWNAKKVSLHLSKVQESGKQIKGNQLCKEIEKMPVLNANVLDYLLAHPELIPEEWKNKVVLFWGTIYCLSDGRLAVRCLSWDGEQWYWHGSGLDGDFRSVHSAVLCAN